MASHNRYGKYPESSSEEISIPMSFPENEPHSPRYSSSESPLTRLINQAPVSKPKSRFAESSGSIESNLKKLVAQKSNQSRYEHEHGPLKGQLSEPLLQGEEEKTTPNEAEIASKISAQLRAKHLKQKVVTSLFNLIVLGGLLGLLICSLTIDRFKGQEFYDVEYWKWIVVLLVIFSGLLITNWVVSVIVFLIEWKYLMQKNVVYFTHGLKDNVKVFIWLGVILGTWEYLVRPDLKILNPDSASDDKKKIDRVIQLISWTLVALVLGSFLWLIKTAMMKVIASSFSMNRYFDRIKLGIFHNYVLQSLSGPQLFHVKYEDGKVDLGNMDDQENIDFAKLHKMKKDKVPFSAMRLLTNVLSNSGMHTMSDTLNKKVVEGGVELDDDEITSEEEATAIAFKIYCNIVGPGNHHRESINEHDLLKFILPEELKLVYPLFDADKSKSITLQEFCAAVVKMHQDRTALQLAMNDSKTAVNQLDNIVKTIMVVLIFVFWLIITEIAPTNVLVFLSSQLLVAAFIFGNSCKTLFEAIIFVFVTHAFDVGDRCVIDGDVMVVEEMKLLTTVFLKFGEKVYYPNNILATKRISNYYRSPNMGDAIDFSVDYKTTRSKLDSLIERVKQYIEANEKLWQSHSVAVKGIDQLYALKMSLVVFHTCNFQNTSQIKSSRTKLYLELMTIFDELEITYHLLPQEVHVRNN